MTGETTDRFDPGALISHTTRFTGLRWDVRTDEVRLSTGEAVRRDFVVHPGAVGIVALNEADEVLLVQQYRHPTGYYLWEPPAGLMDAANESPLQAAQRELLEESGYEAQQWDVLLDWFNSPGGSSEAFRCFLARDVQPHPGGRPERGAEEADMALRWVSLDTAVELVCAGQLQNPTAVSGIMATALARSQDWKTLRPADAPWVAREHLLSADRVWLPPNTENPPDHNVT